ncbi:MAG TPA: hypothetical protein VNV66_07015 [Pilimelia sp.]|nr:hypothetical protein [Pilimelia sp.]
MLKSLPPVRRWLARTALLLLIVGVVAAASALLGNGPAFSIGGACILALAVADDWIGIVGGSRKPSSSDNGDPPDGSAA